MSRILEPSEDTVKGFTLIEALLAIFLLSVALLGTASVLYSTMGYNEYAENVTTATTLAQDKIEGIKNTSYSSIAAGTVDESNIDDEGNAGGIYTRSTTVDDTTLTNMKIIMVTVNWNWKGRARNISLKTILKE